MIDRTEPARDDAATANQRDVAEVTQADPLAPRPGTTVDGREVRPPAPPAPGQLADGTAAVYSDLHCPLLVEDADKNTNTVVEQLANAEGEPAGRVVHRRPEQLVVSPVECPTCGIVVERHMLVPSPVTGTRDCAIAINMRGNPAYTKLFGAMAGNEADAQAEATRHGAVGKRVLDVLGPKDRMPALEEGAPRASLSQRRDPALVRGENLNDEAAAEHDRLDQERADSREASAGAYRQTTETVAPGPRAAAAAAGDRGPTAGVDAATDHPVPPELATDHDRDRAHDVQTDGGPRASESPATLAAREDQVRARLDAATDPTEKARLADELQAIQDHRRESGS